MITIGRQKVRAIIDSLKAGVVPREGIQHIASGRHLEIDEVLSDLKKIEAGFSQIRFIIGDYGSGKSFFMTQASLIAAEQNFVSTKLDITTEKMLFSRDEKARVFYCELVKNLSVKSKPGTGALKSIIETWIVKKTGINQDSPGKAIWQHLGNLKDSISGYDFSRVICKYYEGYSTGDHRLMDNCLRYLSGEYQTKSEAKVHLGVDSVINDRNYYDYIKLLSRFIKDAGYSGLLICIDELAILTGLPSQIRSGNYDMILKILNDCLQHQMEGLYFLLGGTPEFLKHPAKGLYSYGALKTRLSENPFSDKKHPDFSGPVIELMNLTGEELLKSFINIRNLFAEYDQSAFLIDNEGIQEFIEWIFKRMGAANFLSPREAIKNFVHLLCQLKNYPEKNWRAFLGTSTGKKRESASEESGDYTRLTKVKL